MEETFSPFWEGLYLSYESMSKMARDWFAHDNNTTYNAEDLIDRQLINIMMRRCTPITREEYEAFINDTVTGEQYRKDFIAKLRAIKNIYLNIMFF